MKVIERTPDRLFLRTRPLARGLGLIAGMLIFAGIGVNKLFNGQPAEAGKLAILFAAFALLFVFFVRQEVVIFDRTLATVTLRSKTVFGAKATTLRLDQIQHAKVEEGSSSADLTKSFFRPILMRTDGTVLPLTGIYETGTQSKALVLSINTWLKPRKG